MNQKIAYYITAHGYGHGTRSCDIIHALHAAAPEVPVVVKTDLPLSFLKGRLPTGTQVIPGSFDTGLIQKDSIQVDLGASLEAVAELYSREEDLLRQETEFIRRENIGVVVADIPAIPLAAAHRAGVPAVATGNFGWNWIYSEFAQSDPRWQPYVDKFRAVYEQTELLLRQPFAEPMSAFKNQIDLPLLASPGTNCRQHIAEQLGIDPALKWVLLSFTTLNLGFQALEKMAHLRRCAVFTVEPLEWPDSGVHCIRHSTASFADALASMDVVVTKPGFGIVSECIANSKPIIYTERENFLEYPVLVEGIEKYCRNTFIPNAELYAGELERALEKIDAAPAPPGTMPRNGAQVAARHILKKMSRKTLVLQDTATCSNPWKRLC